MTKKEFIEWLKDNDFYDDLNDGYFDANLVNYGLQINIPTEKSFVDYYRGTMTWDSFAANYIVAMLMNSYSLLIDAWENVDFRFFRRVTGDIFYHLDRLEEMVKKLKEEDKLIPAICHSDEDDYDEEDYESFEEEE